MYKINNILVGDITYKVINGFTTRIEVMTKEQIERVNHPSYYQDPSGVECITVTRHRDFNIGNAIKYLWRAGLKEEKGLSNKEKQIEDLQKAIFYINDEIKLLKTKIND
jgi:hypothetical protein